MATEANASYNYFRIAHKSIIKDIGDSNSIESGSRSSDEEDRGLPTFALNFNSSERTVTGGSQGDLRGRDNANHSSNSSTESIPRREETTTSQSPGTLRKYQRFGRDRLHSVSPKSRLPTSQSDTRVRSRTQSVECLSLPALHETATGDSGTGDSINHIPVEALAQALPEDYVPVFGFDKTVLVVDRYIIDENKIMEYENRKRGFLPGKSSDNLPNFNSETQPDTNRQEPRSPKKTNIVTRFLLKTFSKSPPPAQVLYQPAVRHHRSRTTTDEYQ